MRINARLDEDTERQLEELAALTGQNLSHVVRDSISRYHAEWTAARGPVRFLALAGSGRSGREDIASDVKAALDDGLAAKLGRPAAPAR